jgi:hypothetical protein
MECGRGMSPTTSTKRHKLSSSTSEAFTPHQGSHGGAAGTEIWRFILINVNFQFIDALPMDVAENIPLPD